MAQPRTRCALVLIDDDDRSVELLARLSHADSYAVALTVGVAAGARRRTLSMLQRLLRADGFQVDTSIGDAAALERLAHLPRPDTLLLDVDADHETALNVIRHARTLSPSLRVVLVTDRASELSEAVAELQPSPLILEKPIDYAELCARLYGDPHARTTSAIVALCPESERASRFGNRG